MVRCIAVTDDWSDSSADAADQSVVGITAKSAVIGRNSANQRERSALPPSAAAATGGGTTARSFDDGILIDGEKATDPEPVSGNPSGMVAGRWLSTWTRRAWP